MILRPLPICLLTAAALAASGCGGGAATDESPTSSVPGAMSVDEAGGPGADAGYEPGDAIKTEMTLPDGRTVTEKLEVAPPKQQGECPPGMVQAGDTCLPYQPSG